LEDVPLGFEGRSIAGRFQQNRDVGGIPIGFDFANQAFDRGIVALADKRFKVDTSKLGLAAFGSRLTDGRAKIGA